MPNHIEDRAKKALDAIAGVLREKFAADTEKAEADRYDQHGILKICEDQLKSTCTHCLPVILSQVLHLLENGYQYNEDKQLPAGTSAWSRELSIAFLIRIGFDMAQINTITAAITCPAWLTDV